MYDSDTSVVTSALKGSSTAVFSDTTIANILALTSTTADPVIKVDNNPTIAANGAVTFTSGTELGFVNVSAENTTLTITGDTKTIVLGGTGSANLVVGNPNDTVISGGQQPANVQGGPAVNAAPAATVLANGLPHTDRVVIGSAGDDSITVIDKKNTLIVLGSGDSTVTAGHGVDTIESALGNSTIVGGKGDYAVVKQAGNSANYTVSDADGHAVLTNSTTHKTTDITGIQFVQFDNGESLVFAKDVVEGQAGLMYQVAFGRDADASGMDHWFDTLSAGGSIWQIANNFVNSAEFVAAHAGQTDQQFVQSLYQNTFGRAADAGGLAYWTDLMSHGASKAALVASFADLAVQNVAGDLNTEVQVIGNVTIVSGII